MAALEVMAARSIPGARDIRWRVSGSGGDFSHVWVYLSKPRRCAERDGVLSVAVGDERRGEAIAGDVVSEKHVSCGVVVAIFEAERGALVRAKIDGSRSRRDPGYRPENGRGGAICARRNPFAESVAADGKEELGRSANSGINRASDPCARSEMVGLGADVEMAHEGKPGSWLPSRMHIEQVPPRATLESAFRPFDSAEIQQRKCKFVWAGICDLRRYGLLVVIVDDAIPPVVTGERHRPCIRE